MIKRVRSENSGNGKSLRRFVHLEGIAFVNTSSCVVGFEQVLQSRKCKSKITSEKTSALEPDRLPMALWLTGLD